MRYDLGSMMAQAATPGGQSRFFSGEPQLPQSDLTVGALFGAGGLTPVQPQNRKDDYGLARLLAAAAAAPSGSVVSDLSTDDVPRPF